MKYTLLLFLFSIQTNIYSQNSTSNIIWLQNSGLSYNSLINGGGVRSYQNFLSSITNIVESECLNEFIGLFYDAVYYNPKTLTYYYASSEITNSTNLKVPKNFSTETDNPYTYIKNITPTKFLYYDPVSKIFFTRTLTPINDQIKESEKVVPIIKYDQGRRLVEYYITQKTNNFSTDKKIVPREFGSKEARLNFNEFTTRLDPCYKY